MKSRIFAIGGLFVLLFSCALPNQMKEERMEDDVFVEEAIVEEAAVEKNVEGAGAPPIYIEGGVDGKNKKELYANFHNAIKVYVDGGNTEHLEVFASGIGLTPSNVKEGLYTFHRRTAGTVVEIVARDTVSGRSIVKLFDIVSFPAPEAYIWKYRTIFRDKVAFTAEEFKKQNAVILQHSTRVPVLCLAESYRLIRVDNKGERSVHENVDKEGLFDEESKKMIAAATKGDIFIVQNIKSSCSPFPIKDIVYTIE